LDNIATNYCDFGSVTYTLNLRNVGILYTNPTNRGISIRYLL